MNETACLLDSNVWIALTFDSHPGHKAATNTMALPENRPALFCRATQQSFLRLISTPALTQQYGAAAMTNNDALDILDRFMASPDVTYHEEPTGLFPLWRQLAARPFAAPRAWMDGYLAAFAIADGVKLITLDHQFALFEDAGLDLLLLAVS